MTPTAPARETLPTAPAIVGPTRGTRSKRTSTSSADNAPLPPAPLPGDDATIAVTRLLAREGPRIRALTLRLCKGDAEAQDAMQDTFVAALRGWKNFRGESEPGTWLYTIALRTCRARWRKKARRSAAMPGFNTLVPFAETTVMAAAARGPDAAQRAIDREALSRMQEAVAHLPEHFRVALVLKEILELPVEQVAEVLGLKEDTVKTRLHRARLLLRQTLTRNAPAIAAPAPIYDRQVCLDLLKAKLAAMDAGRESVIPRAEICARCRAVFQELNMVQDACARLAHATIPADLKARIMRAINDRDRRAEKAAPAKRGRKPVASTRKGR